ncbi:MAG TPA: helix-turn-helix domain-containing protein [Solirubrobacteraceae bacterium]|nr:helix-turn-helix domain-containing protein [Solirubrobacteraceae bacterium]
MRVNELALSQAFLPSLARAGIHTVEQLAERDLGELLRQPEFRSGVELYELIRELHRHGLTPFAAHGSHVQTERELQMFRLRAVEGLTLAQIGERFTVKGERVRQLLKLHFGLGGVPPAAKRRAPVKPHPLTLSERRRVYRLARLTVMRTYHTPLTLEEVARTVASSPRQVHRAYAEFGKGTFHDDLTSRRLDAAARLLQGTSIPVAVVARRVGYSDRSHFAHTFRHRYGVSPSTYRARSRQEPGEASAP